MQNLFHRHILKQTTPQPFSLGGAVYDQFHIHTFKESEGKELPNTLY